MPGRVSLPGVGAILTTRTATYSTKQEIASLSAKPTKPAWLKVAIHNAIHDRPMSRKREDRMRLALGMKPLPVVAEVPVCPIHGVVHDAGPCATDAPVVAVVALSPGQRVTTSRPWRYTRLADMPVSMLARAIRERVDYDNQN